MLCAKDYGFHANEYFKDGISRESAESGVSARAKAMRDQQPRIPTGPKAQPEPRRGHRFTDSEHNRLLGAACFIYDMQKEMSEIEQAGYWKSFARSSAGHSAQEWEEYWHKTVKPIYLAHSKRSTLHL